jgi:hypothetical protein
MKKRRWPALERIHLHEAVSHAHLARPSGSRAILGAANSDTEQAGMIRITNTKQEKINEEEW